MTEQQQAERTLYERAGELIRGVEELGATCPVHQTGYELAIDFRRMNDPTPFTEKFARSVAVDERDYDNRRVYEISANPFAWIEVWQGSTATRTRVDLQIHSENNDCIKRNPTIGDFYTACRLFKVQLKEGA